MQKSSWKNWASISYYKKTSYTVLLECGRMGQSVKDDNIRLRHKHSFLNKTCLSLLASSIVPLKERHLEAELLAFAKAIQRKLQQTKELCCAHYAAWNYRRLTNTYDKISIKCKSMLFTYQAFTIQPSSKLNLERLLYELPCSLYAIMSNWFPPSKQIANIKL